MFYLIYKITNTVNNKIYIGKHKTKNKEDGYMGSGTVLKRAFEKYGVDKFVKEILYEFSSEEEMDNMERLIVDDDFIKREDTYNVMVGGSGGFGFINNNNLNNSANNHYMAENKRLEMLKNDDEFKKRFSEAVKSGLTEEIIKQISESLKKTWKENGFPWTGRSHTEYTKRKIGEKNRTNHIGDKNSQYGTMWICNTNTNENKKIKNTDTIPGGWKKGRIINKSL